MIRLVFTLATSSVLLGQSVQNVLLVVNESSAISVKIGQYYAQRRNLPAKNLCRLRTTAVEVISREDYEFQIERPVARCLKSRHLVEQILYIVTTLGIPLKISGSGGMRGDSAAVDSELTLLYEKLHGRNHNLAGAIPNPLYRHREEPFQHPRYPIYLVTRLAGYDFEDVKGVIDRALAARNRGRFVLDLDSNSESPGNEWLRVAAFLLPSARVVLDESPAVLYNQKEVIGYASWGSNDKNRKRRWLGFQWLAGAIATEYVSTNARTFQKPPDNWIFTTWQDTVHYFAGSPQSLTADYIHEGATGASGHVDEPYLLFTPRPDYLFPAYYNGRNLAESFYISIPALSWMNIVVGDPLCSLGKPEEPH
jgi:uncharacterized protein (TIGR03790 family)